MRQSDTHLGAGLARYKIPSEVQRADVRVRQGGRVNHRPCIADHVLTNERCGQEDGCG